MSLDVKVIKGEYNFRTKISDSINNCIPHGENNPHQGVVVGL